MKDGVRCKRLVLASVLGVGLATSAWAYIPQSGWVSAWGGTGYDFGQTSVPDTVRSGVTAVAPGLYFNLALKYGQVIAWGTNDYGQLNVPTVATSGVSAIAAAYFTGFALKNGGVLAWGDNSYGLTSVPQDATSGVTALAAGWKHALALKNGRVIAWGSNDFGQASVPAAATFGVSAIAASRNISMALKFDNEVLVWGDNTYGQTNVPPVDAPVKIAAGGYNCAMLNQDGHVVVWGDNTYGQTIVPAAASTGVTAIALGDAHLMALKGQQIINWGYGGYGQTSLPPDIASNVVALADGVTHSLAILGSSARVYWQDPQGTVAEWTLSASGAPIFSRSLANTGPAWELKAVADLDGDGIEDLYWQRTTDGLLAVWLMNLDGTVRYALALSGALGDWELKACASPDAHNIANLYFQRPDGMAAMWYVDWNGSGVQPALIGNVQDWKLCGAANINQAADTGIYWQNASGTVASWWPPHVIGNVGAWQLRAAADIDGDNRADLFWQAPSGVSAVWVMNATGAMQSATTWNTAGAWRLCGAASAHGGTLPASFSLTNAMPPIYDSLQLKTNWWPINQCCQFFAATYYTLGAYVKRFEHPEWDMADPQHQFSPVFSMDVETLVPGSTAGHFSALGQYGCTDMAEFPYTNIFVSVYPTVAQRQAALAYRVVGYDVLWAYYTAQGTPTIPPYSTSQALINKAKSYLVSGHVLDVALGGDNQTFPDVHGNPPARFYDPVVTEVSPVTGMGHQVVLCGYDDNINPTATDPDHRGGFLLANMWGTDWNGAMHGYLWVSYAYVKAFVGDCVVITGVVSDSPTITGCDAPQGRVGDSILITGTGFGSERRAARVTFNGVAATNVFFLNDAIQTTVPAGATSGWLVVQNWTGKASNPIHFTVIP